MTDSLSMVYGIHAVKALLRNPYRSIKKVLINQDSQHTRLNPIYESALANHIPIERLSLQQLDQHHPDINHQGVVAFATPQPLLSERDIPLLLEATASPALILILDGVTDPHNLGACLRVADGAGVDCVIIPKDKSATITPTVSKVASGAAESVPVVRVTNLVRAIELLKQHHVWIYGAAGEASAPFYTLDCQTSLALVMGAEDSGLRHLTRKHCDGLFSLPMRGGVTSLNVSVATGICLYEAVRQRHHRL